MACVYLEIKNEKPWKLKDIPIQNKKPDVEESSKSRCDICKETFEDEPQLNEHRKVHFTVVLLSCPDCKDKFLNKTTLESHRKAFHLTEIPKVVEEKVAMSKPKIVYKCQYCQRSFQFQNPLEFRGHVKNCQNAQKLAKPPSSSVLKMTNHTKIQTASCEKLQFKCNICQKSFKTKYFLNSHSLIHSSKVNGIVVVVKTSMRK